MTSNYDAVIIGSGLGGLTAAALMSNAGHRVLVLERHPFLGGAATTYQRGPLTVEASLHETTLPDSPGDLKQELFELIGLKEKIKFIEAPIFQEVRWNGLSSPIQMPHGFDAIQFTLDSRFPELSRSTEKMIKQMKRIHHLTEFRSPANGLGWRLRNSIGLPQDILAAAKNMKDSLSDVFTEYFGDNEAIKIALSANLTYYTDDPDNYWWLAFVLAQGGYLKSGGYYIQGGSQQLTNHLVEYIRHSRGDIYASCPATRIVVDDSGAVSGVTFQDNKTKNETTINTGVVFANAAPQVVNKMLPSINQQQFMEQFTDRELSISLVSATIGLDRPASEFGVKSYSTILVPDWVKKLSDFRDSAALFSDFPKQQMPVSTVVDYSQIDSGICGNNIFPVNIVCPDRLDNWDGLDKDRYKEKSQAWLSAIIQQLDNEWPGISKAVKHTTISTARSIHEHLNTPAGAVYGFAMTPPEEFPKGPPQNAKTAIKGLWLSSAYTGFGGFTGAIGGGILAANTVLKESRKASQRV